MFVFINPEQKITFSTINDQYPIDKTTHRYRGMEKFLVTRKPEDFPTGQNDCQNGCGAWITAASGCAAPPGVHPFGPCPKASF